MAIPCHAISSPRFARLQLRRNDATHYWAIVKQSAATNSLGNLADVTHWYFASFLHSQDSIARRRTGTGQDPTSKCRETLTSHIRGVIPDRPPTSKDSIAETENGSQSETRHLGVKPRASSKRRRAIVGMCIVTIVACIAWSLITGRHQYDRAGPPDNLTDDANKAASSHATRPIGEQPGSSAAKGSAAAPGVYSSMPSAEDPIPTAERRPNTLQVADEKVDQADAATGQRKSSKSSRGDQAHRW